MLKAFRCNVNQKWRNTVTIFHTQSILWKHDSFQSIWNLWPVLGYYCMLLEAMWQYHLVQSLKLMSQSVFAARVEREWRLPSLPTAGPGLHLLLREEDPAGGAGEGLHVLQACEDIKEFCFWRATINTPERPLLSVSFTNLMIQRAARWRRG